MDFTIFDERRKCEYPISERTRARIKIEAKPKSAFSELFAPIRSLRLLSETVAADRATLRVSSAASPSLSFSQSINRRGRLCSALSCAVHNALHRLDTLCFEAKSGYGEGAAFEGNWTFPFSAFGRRSAAVSARRGTETLCEDARVEESVVALSANSRSREESAFEAALSRRRLAFNALDFPCRETDFARRSAVALTFRYSRFIVGAAETQRNVRLTTESTVFARKAPDLRARLAVQWKSDSFDICSLNHSTTFGAEVTAPNSGLSPLYTPIMAAPRGFGRVEAGLPFPPSGRVPDRRLSLSHSSRLLLKGVPLFGFLAQPFAHISGQAELAGGTRAHVALGLGVAATLSGGLNFEFLFNFGHFSLAASPFNRAEVFQFRLSTGE